jgi:hypothetical protein
MFWTGIGLLLLIVELALLLLHEELLMLLLLLKLVCFCFTSPFVIKFPDYLYRDLHY